ncbi:HAD-IC family P-type ATPase, partial [Patescibacteria group bacterium]|nr:HAD-IC family P-type ATPase [Patescibacteria group bacterium]
MTTIKPSINLNIKTADYHHLPIKEVFSNLKANHSGLSQKEASLRLDKFGFNKLPEAAKLSALALFLNQFKNPLIYILFVALIISFSTKHLVDAWIILAVILVSSVVGFLQEHKANEALSRLKQMVKHKAEVIRDSKEMIVAQENIVPGDIIILSPVDKVPADARLIEAHDLEVIESALTGESMPVNKNIDPLPQNTAMADRINMVYLGTVISRGKAKAIVTATGSQTEIGHIATLVKETEEGETPLQKQLVQFGKIIGIILVVLNVFIFGLGILTGKPLLEMFMTSVAVVVAAVPEGLLPAMTVILAIGMQRLAKQKGLVRKMLAAETLGSVSVICSDKTGTLTQGEMRVAEIITETTKLSHDGDKFSKTIQPDGEASHIIALKIGLLCNNAIIENPEDELHKWTIVGNPTEKALLLAGRAAGLKKEELEKEEPRVAEIPFDSEYKFMATRHKIKVLRDKKYAVYVKGAPEKLLPLISFVDVEGKKEALTETRKTEIQKQCEELTSTGLRVIAVAYKLEENDVEFTKENLNNLVFVGLVALKDPLRLEAKETIELCQSAGIRPVI